MESILNFAQLTAHLRKLNRRKRAAIVCANDPNTEYAASRALEERIAEFLIIGDSTILKKYPTLKQYPEYVKTIHIENSDEATREAVRIVREGGVNVLMKEIIGTDNLLRTILDKEKGLLPKGEILAHLAAMGIPTYHKLSFFSDTTVIPRPTLQRRVKVIWYTTCTCRHFGIERPRIALIHCTEKVSAKFPHSLDYMNIIELAKTGEFGNVIIDGPLGVRTACEQIDGDIKGIISPINGQVDVLIFSNIESGNAFYKSVSLFAQIEMVRLPQGPICLVVLPSRNDSGLSRYYSIVTARL